MWVYKNDMAVSLRRFYTTVLFLVCEICKIQFFSSPFKVHHCYIQNINIYSKLGNECIKNFQDLCQQLTGKPSFCMMRAYFRAASRESASFLAPVITILPDLNRRAVVCGSRILITMPENRDGLYSEFRVRKFIFIRSKGQAKFTVETTFLNDMKLKYQF
jgi:hypothetical protein